MTISGDTCISLFYTRDENIHGIQFSGLAQNDQIHQIKYQRILTFEFQLTKLSLRDTYKYNNKRDLNLANLQLAK